MVSYQVESRDTVGGSRGPQAHMAKQPKTKESSAIGRFNHEDIEKLVGIS